MTAPWGMPDLDPAADAAPVTSDAPPAPVGDLREHQERLERAERRVAEARYLATRLDQARAAHAAASEVVMERERAVAEEDDDIRALESLGPTRIWAALRGRVDDDLARERAEREAARYAAGLARDERDRHARTAEALAAELAGLGDVDGEVARALAAKEHWLRATGAPGGAELDAIAHELGHTELQLREVSEAEAAGHDAVTHLDVALTQLGRAGDWALLDTMGGGWATDVMKYSRLDEATAALHQARAALAHLGTELADLGMTATDEVAVDELTRGFDVWFDNVFTDFSVAQRVERARQQAEHVRGQVAWLLGDLATRRTGLATRAQELATRRDHLLRR